MSVVILNKKLASTVDWNTVKPVSVADVITVPVAELVVMAVILSENVSPVTPL